MTEPGKVISARGLAAELETSYHHLSKWLRQQRDAGHPVRASFPACSPFRFTPAHADQLAAEFAAADSDGHVSDSAAAAFDPRPPVSCVMPYWSTLLAWFVVQSSHFFYLAACLFRCVTAYQQEAASDATRARVAPSFAAVYLFIDTQAGYEEATPSVPLCCLGVPRRPDGSWSRMKSAMYSM